MYICSVDVTSVRSTNDAAVDVLLVQVTVSEHLPAGSTVVTVTATDRDSADNGKVTYRVMSSTRDIFYIDSRNGKNRALHHYITLSLPLTESLFTLNSLIK